MNIDKKTELYSSAYLLHRDLDKPKEAVEKHDDNYAKEIIRNGKSLPLHPSDLALIKDNILNKIADSHHKLGDFHTANMISEVISTAIEKSETFRNSISFGVKEKRPLGNITFKNEFDVVTYASAYDTPEFTFDNLHNGRVSLVERAVTAPQKSVININMAPNRNSHLFDAWARTLIHEMIHAITGAEDPPEHLLLQHLGPTEILTMDIMREMGLHTPEFSSYGDENRVEYLGRVQAQIIEEVIGRYDGNNKKLLERRLDEICLAHQSIEPGEASDEFIDREVTSLILPAFLEDFDEAPNHQMPKKNEMDEHADTILQESREYILSDAERTRTLVEVRTSVLDSRRNLFDKHTGDMIKETITRAMQDSATFRSIVAYSNTCSGDNEKITPLSKLTYINEYEFDDDNSHIIPICEAADNGVIYYSIAPRRESEYMPSWQHGLIHEIIHQLTNSVDPEGAYAEGHYGPTETIARNISREMGEAIPDLGGYDSDERILHLRERNSHIITDVMQRENLTYAKLAYRLNVRGRPANTPPEYNKMNARKIIDQIAPQKMDDSVLPAQQAGHQASAPVPFSATLRQALPVPLWAEGLPPAQQLRVEQLNTSGSWNNDSGELMPFLLAEAFPQVTFRILNGNHIQTFNEGHSQVAYLTREGNHYTPWVAAGDGGRRLEPVLPDGNCFFASIFFAVHNRLASPQEIQAMRELFSRHYADNADYYDQCLLDLALMNAVSETRQLTVTHEQYQARVASGEHIRLDEVAARHEENDSLAGPARAAPAPTEASDPHFVPMDEQPDLSLRGGGTVQQAVCAQMADLAAAVTGAFVQTPLEDIAAWAREYRMLDTLSEFVRRRTVHQHNIGLPPTEAQTDAVLNALLTEEQNYRQAGDNWQPQARESVTQADIRNAIHMVCLQQQQGEFELWLDGWEPWQAYLEQLPAEQRASLGILSKRGELSRLAYDARTDRTRQALMHAIDQEIDRTWSYGEPVAINEDRTQRTFRKRLLRQAELLNTSMRSQAVDYLSSGQFLQDATRAMHFENNAFRASVNDRILLLQTLTGVVRDATPEGVANIHRALFHSGLRRQGLIHNLFRTSSIVTDIAPQWERDQMDQMTANLIVLLDAIVNRQLLDTPQARSDMQAQIADARVIFTSYKCSGHSLLGYLIKKVPTGMAKVLALRTQSSKAKVREARAVIALLEEKNLLSASVRAWSQVVGILATPVHEERMTFLANSLSPVQQETHTSRSGKPHTLEALVRTLAPVVRHECAGPFDMPTASRFIGLHNRITCTEGADMLYRAEYLGLIARALVNPENHSLAVFALNDMSMQTIMRSSDLTRADFEWLLQAASSLTVSESENSSMEWNSPDVIQQAVSLGERYHPLSTLEVRAGWNRDRLRNEAECQLKAAFDGQLCAALKAAYKKEGLPRPGDWDMNKMVEKAWDKVKDKWILATLRQVDEVAGQEVHRLLVHIATTLRDVPEIAREIQYLAVDVGTDRRLAGAALSGREREVSLPVADTDDLEVLKQLYHDLTDRLGCSITEGERLLGMRLTRGTPQARLWLQGVNAVTEDISNLEMVADGQILQPNSAGIMRPVTDFSALRLQPAAGESPQHAVSAVQEIRSLDATNARDALALIRESRSEGGGSGAIYRATGRVAWELSSAASQAQSTVPDWQQMQPVDGSQSANTGPLQQTTGSGGQTGVIRLPVVRQNSNKEVRKVILEKVKYDQREIRSQPLDARTGYDPGVRYPGKSGTSSGPATARGGDNDRARRNRRHDSHWMQNAGGVKVRAGTDARPTADGNAQNAGLGQKIRQREIIFRRDAAIAKEELTSKKLNELVRNSLGITEKDRQQAAEALAKKEAEEEKKRREAEEKKKKQQEEAEKAEKERRREQQAAAGSDRAHLVLHAAYQLSPTQVDNPAANNGRVRRQGAL